MHYQVVFFVFASLLINSCSCKKESAVSSHGEDKVTRQIYVMTGPSSIVDGEEVIIEGITYQKVMKANQIVHMRTIDEDFISPEGYRIHDVVHGVDCVTEPGWATYFQLPSGWYAASYCEKECECSDLKIQWFFKR